MFNIIKNTKIWFIFSALLMVLSIIFIAVFGLRLGIDYKGGTVIQFESNNSDKITLTRDVLNEKSFTNYQLKETGNSSIALKLPAISNDEHMALQNSLNEKLGNYDETSYDTVGPIISRDLTNRSIWAVVLASVGIIIYIAYAFRKIPKPLSPWKFGLAAVVALIHDLLITTGFVAFLGHFLPWMEVDVLFITALLTIMGFSVHDTIVVYDRLRENFVHNPHKAIPKTAEESVNQTLARSINTSLTVMVVLVAMFLLGGVSIKHFVLTLIIGIFFGTYSSIFVATALMVVWHRNVKNTTA
jgi:preprotein translocase subunit SecF